MRTWRIIHSDSETALRDVGTGVAHAMCTSVPFWLQRRYEAEGSTGTEPTREEWAGAVSRVMAQVHRVLRDDATAFVVVGEAWSSRQRGEVKPQEVTLQAPYLAEVLRASGWWVKALVVIDITNPAPQSVGDRPIQAHQYGILLTKTRSGHYWDKISSRERGVAHDRLMRCVWSGPSEAAYRHYDVDGFRHGSIYPRWVPRKYLSASVSRKGVCPECGTPWAPVYSNGTGGSTGKSWLVHENDDVRGNAKTASSLGYVPGRIESWRPGCECGRGRAPARPLVIDPYTGTSTTGVEALSAGCRYLGVDIDVRSVALSKIRLSEHENEMRGMFDSEHDMQNQTAVFE